MSNEDLIDGLLRGDPKAFIWLHQTCRGKCVGHLLYKVMKITNQDNRDHAEALFGEALVAMTSNVRSRGLTVLRVQPTTYLTTIMVNKYFGGLKAKRESLVLNNPEVLAKLDKDALEAFHEEKDNEQEKENRRKSILINVPKLKPKCRELITLRDLEGLSYKEMLPLLDKSYSLSGLRMQVMRCRESLKKLISQDKIKSNDHDA